MGQQFFNAGVLFAIFYFSYTFSVNYDLTHLYFVIGLSLLIGIFAVAPIGGADMPVVISLLNSYSGLAACAAGFVIQNNLLIVAGAPSWCKWNYFDSNYV